MILINICGEQIRYQSHRYSCHLSDEWNIGLTLKHQQYYISNQEKYFTAKNQCVFQQLCTYFSYVYIGTFVHVWIKCIYYIYLYSQVMSISTCAWNFRCSHQCIAYCYDKLVRSLKQVYTIDRFIYKRVNVYKYVSKTTPDPSPIFIHIFHTHAAYFPLNDTFVQFYEMLFICM